MTNKMTDQQIADRQVAMIASGVLAEKWPGFVALNARQKRDLSTIVANLCTSCYREGYTTGYDDGAYRTKARLKPRRSLSKKEFNEATDYVVDSFLRDQGVTK